MGAVRAARAHNPIGYPARPYARPDRLSRRWSDCRGSALYGGRRHPEFRHPLDPGLILLPFDPLALRGFGGVAGNALSVPSRRAAISASEKMSSCL